MEEARQSRWRGREESASDGSVREGDESEDGGDDASWSCLGLYRVFILSVIMNLSLTRYGLFALRRNKLFFYC